MSSKILDDYYTLFYISYNRLFLHEKPRALCVVWAENLGGNKSTTFSRSINYNANRINAIRLSKQVKMFRDDGGQYKNTPQHNQRVKNHKPPYGLNTGKNAEKY